MTDAFLLRSAAPSRAAVTAAALELTHRGLIVGTEGNVSARLDAEHFLVTPTGRKYATLEPDDLPVVRADGTWYGRARPSSEWRFHRDIYAARPEVGAVVHTHSRHAAMIGFAACKMIRRILGFAHVADFERIVDPDSRGRCERCALELAREMLVYPGRFESLAALVACLGARTD